MRCRCGILPFTTKEQIERSSKEQDLSLKKAVATISSVAISLTVQSAYSQIDGATLRISDEACMASVQTLNSSLNAKAKAEVEQLVTSSTFISVTRMFLGRDSLLDDFRHEFGETAFSQEMMEVKSSLNAVQKQYWNERVNYEQSLNRSLREKYLAKDFQYRGDVVRLTICGLRGLFLAKNFDSKEYRDLSKASPRSARFGYFRTDLNACTVSQTAGTGSSYAEPEKWKGSQFLILDVAFKNGDSEARLPLEGDLIIKQPNGNLLRYDSSETIIAEGYGIGVKPINPFVTMTTKIVYRIPNDISGEVRWEPGRDSKGKSLWCTFLYEGSKP